MSSHKFSRIAVRYDEQCRGASRRDQVVKRVIALTMFCLMASSSWAAPVETYVAAQGPHGPLKGTMLSPGAAGAPVMLIVPGSGPTDRDGNSPLGVKSATYRLLAEGLAEKGVSTVRIDKRGMFASAGAIADANDVTIDDYAADVHSWIASIRKSTGAPCVWVLGHSEGGLVALAAAQRPDGICGLVLVSAAGRPLGIVLREQLKANAANAPMLADAEKAIASLEAGKRIDVSGMHWALQGLFGPHVQGFLISEMSLDPAKLIASYAGPVQIVQGDQDIQVGVVDAQRLKQAAPSAQLVILPGINHVLKAVADNNRGANLAAYADPSLPLGAGVADAIAGFVKSAGK
jgi:pimeloyl-ACP methyl ester carboxylesterase